MRARELDKHFKETGRTVGRLHGLPISLKVRDFVWMEMLRYTNALYQDQLSVKGRITSMGFLSVHHTSQPSPSTALLCEILEKEGAIFYCHTTLPQSIMQYAFTAPFSTPLFADTPLPLRAVWSANRSGGER